MEDVQVPPTIEITDEVYNKLMDDIISSCGGNVQDVVDEITRLGLHRPGIGKTLVDENQVRLHDS